jgi:RNA polymerase sigma-70 factor (family 1)
MDNILENIKSGNIHVFTEVYHQYVEQVWLYVYKYTHSRFIAEEVSQLTFIKLWEKKDKLSSEYNISIQIFRIAKSLTIDLLRKESKQYTEEISLTSLSEDLYTLPTDIDLKEKLKIALDTIATMPPIRKKVVTLSRMEGKTYKEISEHLHISEKTVESHLYKAMKQLKKVVSLLTLINY